MNDDSMEGNSARGQPLPALLRFRLRAQLGQGGRRRDRLGVDLEMNDGRQAGRLRRLEGGRKFFRFFDGDAETAESTGIGREVRILQVVAETRPG